MYIRKRIETNVRPVCIPVFSATLSITAKTQNQPKYLSTDNSFKLACIYNRTLLSLLEKSLPTNKHEQTNIRHPLSDISQAKKDKHHVHVESNKLKSKERTEWDWWGCELRN